MENLKAQKKILTLGKAIVKELQLEPGVDTLSKWMAHYVAEKIELAETLTGDKKKQAEKECFDSIHKLWEHRWSIPREKPFLYDFEPIFDTLHRLNPKRETPFFFTPQIIFEIKEEIKASEAIPNKLKDSNNGLQYYLDLTLKVEKLSRYILTCLLNQGVSELDISRKRKDIIKTSIDFIDYPEAKIIKFTTANNNLLGDQEEEITKTTKKISTLNNRIDDLEEYKSIIISLIENHKQELLKIKGSLNDPEQATRSSED